MTNSRIVSASALISDFDPALARIFVNQPFRRTQIVTLFCAQVKNAIGEDLTSRIEAHLLMAIEADRMTWAEADGVPA